MRKTAFLVLLFLAVAGFLFAGGTKEGASKAQPLVVATVNNPDMIIMEHHTQAFTDKTGIPVNYVTMPENELRQKVTEDVALGAGKFDIVTIGTYDTPFWGKNKWIDPLDPLFARMSQADRDAYDVADLMPPIKSALSYDGQLYALPFYGESSMLFYRKDIMAKAGITVPEHPTWQQVFDIAKKVNDPSHDFYGIVLRGLPGWGENMAVFDTIINTFGARWYNMKWEPQFNTPQMRQAWEFYKKIITEAGEPGPSTVGFTEGLALMTSGKAAMWYDATVAAGALNAKDSKVAGEIGYAFAPTVKTKYSGWLWSWALAIESASKEKDNAMKFLTWAPSKDYIALIGKEVGWGQIPPGTRISTYKNPNYLAAAPFAPITLDSIENAPYDQPTVDPVPYKGVQYVAIPEFQGLGTKVSQELAAYLTGQKSLDDALASCQQDALQVAQQGGYLKQ